MSYKYENLITINNLQKQINELQNQLDTLKKELTLEEPILDLEKEYKSNSRYFFCKLHQEHYCDRGCSWYEDEFIPIFDANCNKFGFDTIEDALKFLNKNPELFSGQKLYIEDNKRNIRKRIRHNKDNIAYVK